MGQERVNTMDKEESKRILEEAAIRARGTNVPSSVEPLTLEQLREMDGKPVYLYIYDTALSSGWHIIKAVTKDKIIFRGWDTVYVPISSIGKSFDLYAYPPARIDREKWTAEWVKYDGYTECSKCEYWYNSSENEDEGDRPAFCPSCGRAMTQGAMEVLESRFNG